MDTGEFMRSVIELRAALANARANNVDLNRIPSSRKVYDFNQSKEDYYRTAVQTGLSQVKTKSKSLSKLEDFSPENSAIIGKIKGLVSELDLAEFKDPLLAKIAELVPKINVPELQKIEKPKSLPSEISADVNADIEEMNKAFSHGCCRSVAILCGRILEVSLHRKYFEVTGVDLLEKSPGIGLGKIIAKLSEKNVNFDPGLTQQIHLINNIRISSVHVKQEPFTPSKSQAEAMMLYTMDILSKIFQNKNK